MKDAELYEYAEKVVGLFRATPEGGVTPEMFEEALGTEVPSEEDRAKILQLITELMDHETSTHDEEESEDRAYHGEQAGEAVLQEA